MGSSTLGTSNGAGMAQYVAGVRSGVAGQVHTTVDDLWRDEGIEAAVAAAAVSGATTETFDYPGAGHLFADPSKPDEYQPQEADQVWARVLSFVERRAG
jgi:dienelactone hydrolase